MYCHEAGYRRLSSSIVAPYVKNFFQRGHAVGVGEHYEEVATRRGCSRDFFIRAGCSFGWANQGTRTEDETRNLKINAIVLFISLILL